MYNDYIEKIFVKIKLKNINMLTETDSITLHHFFPLDFLLIPKQEKEFQEERQLFLLLIKLLKGGVEERWFTGSHFDNKKLYIIIDYQHDHWLDDQLRGEVQFEKKEKKKREDYKYEIIQVII